MKTYIKNLFLLPALIAGLGLIPAGRATAQTFTTLHSFTVLNNYTNSDGANPHTGLILSGNTLYGTAASGGSSGEGTVFAVNTDGTGFTNLYSFTPLSGAYPFTNSDGATPLAGLILSGNTLYGTARDGGRSANGTVFKINTNGTGFTVLYSFTANPYPSTNSDGANPVAGLILSSNTLYGTANYGGSSERGTVFALNTNGTGFTTLHSFTDPDPSTGTNSDGANPHAGLILSSNTLYGTAAYSGSLGNGTVFAANTDGTGFTTQHSFTALLPPPYYYTNSDGASPGAGLFLSGNTLYGTAGDGGSSGNGTVFAVNTDGTGFTTLHRFTGVSGGYYPYYYNSDGAKPLAGLFLSGNTLYGTAWLGGSSGRGTVFALNTNGTGFTTLHSFTGASDGVEPSAGLIISGNTLYGTAYKGGNAGNGTVFSLSLGSVSAPQLTIIRSGANVILRWPTNAAGFTLQSTTNLVSPAVWTTVSPGPIIADGQNAVTNPVSGTQQFYRLSQ
jgi:uncharacterized repeat protein (TIGR03803 family)